MFDKILGKSKLESQEDQSKRIIIDKISNMNLSDMRVYVNDRLQGFEICEDGLSEVVRKLVTRDSNGKRLVESDAMDSKIKKAFDLIIMIAGSKKMTIVTSELIGEFIVLYADIIKKFDRDHKQIYNSKLKDCLVSAIATIETKTQINHKMKILNT